MSPAKYRNGNHFLVGCRFISLALSDFKPVCSTYCQPWVIKPIVVTTSSSTSTWASLQELYPILRWTGNSKSIDSAGTPDWRQSIYYYECSHEDRPFLGLVWWSGRKDPLSPGGIALPNFGISNPRCIYLYKPIGSRPETGLLRVLERCDRNKDPSFDRAYESGWSPRWPKTILEDWLHRAAWKWMWGHMNVKYKMDY